MRNIEEEIRITEGEIEVSVDLWEYQLLAWDIFGPSYKNRSKRRDALQQITVSLGRTWTSFFFFFFKLRAEVTGNIFVKWSMTSRRSIIKSGL